MNQKKSKSRKIRRRDLVREVAVQFRDNLPRRSPMPKMVTRRSRKTVAHYELAGEAIKEFIDAVGGALSENREVTLRGFGRLIPRQYKPMKVRLPGALPGDEDAMISVPVRMGVFFRASSKLKQSIREHDEKHGLPTTNTDSSSR